MTPSPTGPETTPAALRQRNALGAESSLRWARAWGRSAALSLRIAVLACSSSSLGAKHRHETARHYYTNTLPALSWFVVLSALVALVLTRIVVVTAAGYGLSGYALEMIIRVLVLELIPLGAAGFVAVHSALPMAAEIASLRRRGQLGSGLLPGEAPPLANLQASVVPRAVAAGLGVITLAVVSATVALVLAYAAVYGASANGWAQYTRTFGQVFTPSVVLVLVLKTLAMAAAVALVPPSAAALGWDRGDTRTRAELGALVRLFGALLLIEVASLMANYY
jgi:phospholipid/cholesterol/gamma-HCH transport system permease protein